MARFCIWLKSNGNRDGQWHLLSRRVLRRAVESLRPGWGGRTVATGGAQRNPWKAGRFSPSISAPEGQGKHSIADDAATSECRANPRGEASLAPSGAKREMDGSPLSTGSAALHPWLHSHRPIRDEESTLDRYWCIERSAYEVPCEIVSAIDRDGCPTGISNRHSVLARFADLATNDVSNGLHIPKYSGHFSQLTFFFIAAIVYTIKMSREPKGDRAMNESSIVELRRMREIAALRAEDVSWEAIAEPRAEQSQALRQSVEGDPVWGRLLAEARQELPE